MHLADRSPTAIWNLAMLGFTMKETGRRLSLDLLTGEGAANWNGFLHFNDEEAMRVHRRFVGMAG